MQVQSIKVEPDDQYIQFKVRSYDDMKLISALTYTLFKGGKMVSTNKFIDQKKINKGVIDDAGDDLVNDSKKEHMSFSFRVNLSHMGDLYHDLLIFKNEQLQNDENIVQKDNNSEINIQNDSQDVQNIEMDKPNNAK